jgi:hypothetical protein
MGHHLDCAPVQPLSVKSISRPGEKGEDLTLNKVHINKGGKDEDA